MNGAYGSLNFGWQEMRLIDFDKKWCVFGHSVAGSSEVFYLGVCRLTELYDFTFCYRNSWWRDHITDETSIRVAVLAVCDDERIAGNVMRQMYDDLKPVANTNGYQMTGRTIVHCVEGQYKGQNWGSITDAAKRCGISAGALSNHLNNRAGYNTVKGMKFKRGFQT